MRRSTALFTAARRLYSTQAPVSVRQTKILINNQWVNSASGKTFPTFNPATEQKITDIQEGDAADIEKAVQAAKAAFTSGPWPKMTGVQRGRLLNKLADLIEKNMDELARLEVLDNGKSMFEAANVDLPMVVACFRYYAGWPDKIHGKTIEVGGPFGGVDKFFAYTRREPVGVVGQIIPWNFPLLMQAWKLGPALAAGCTVVLKPAEQTSLSALRIGELIIEAGFPPGVVNIVPGYGPTAGHSLAIHPDVDKVAFTGSTEVGFKVFAAASKNNLKRVTLELGGKSPNIVFDDADIDKAIAGAQLGLFLNQGQCCIAGSRLFVHKKIYDEFVEKSVAAAQARKVGDPFHPQTMQGPQVDNDQFTKVMGYIKKGQEEGARLMTGGNRVGDKGYFVQPTVFADVKDDMIIAKEEIFGPVMSILKFEDTEEIIARANKTIYGLGAGIWTKDISKAHHVAHKIRAGTVYVNCYDVLDHAIPFGGFKQSGIGRELGEQGLEPYLEHKSVVVGL